MWEKTNIQQEREQRWSIKLLQIEAAQLARERVHLVVKAKERPLESWEVRRLHESIQELATLSSQLYSVGLKGFQQEGF